MVVPTAASINAALLRAAALLPTQPAEAEKEVRTVLAQAPRHPGARLIAGSARRRMGDLKAARRWLEPLAAEQPGAAHVQQEWGLNLLSLGQTKPALLALRRATALKTELPEAWRATAEILRRSGDAAGASEAYSRQVATAKFDPILAAVAAAIDQNRPAQADAIALGHLSSQPDDVVALRLRAAALAMLSRPAEAESLLGRCLALFPDYHGARYDLASIMLREFRCAEAAPLIDRLLEVSPRDIAYRTLEAALADRIGEHERAVRLITAVLEEHPREARLWLNLGHGLKSLGRADEAAAAYEKSIALEPTRGEAWWSRANLKVLPFTPSQVADMTALVNKPGLSAEDRLHIHYALGKAREDAGDYARSFEHYAGGAALRRRMAPFSATLNHALVERSKSLFTAEFFAQRANGGAQAGDPIFIVGLPRSGSTLVEQILASHPDVEGTMELPDITEIARRVAGGDEGGYPAAIGLIDPAGLRALGEGYLASTRPHRRLGRPFFIDKMPNNFMHLGLIHLILPRARIIDVRRSPMASCFAAFKQHFAQGHAFSYDLTDVGLYYRDYLELMDHFDQVLPGRVLRVVYEDLVEDTEGQIRRLLAALDLPFDEACLRFHENARAVRTPSAEQVRRPIFRDSLELWRHYEPWLGPLKKALGPELAG